MLLHMFYYGEFFVWTSHCQVAYESSILCECIGSNMHVLGGLHQSSWIFMGYMLEFELSLFSNLGIFFVI
jgi:hypothetical protein